MTYPAALKMVCRLALYAANGSLNAKEIIEAVRIVREEAKKKKPSQGQLI
jgi:hypothetical protein